MAKYLTQAWCDLYKDAINNSKAYEQAAMTWEGDFYFVTDVGGPITEPIYMYVDLWHGKCRACEMVADPNKYKPAYVLSAPYSVWKLISTKQLDSTRALVTGQSKLIGNMPMVMRYSRAASELSTCTLQVPTEWLD